MNPEDRLVHLKCDVIVPCKFATAILQNYDSGDYNLHDIGKWNCGICKKEKVNK